MAFVLQSFGLASVLPEYVTLQSGVVSGCPSFYSYISAQDTQATIAAANYFAGAAYTLDLGDFIYVVDSTNTPEQYYVSAINKSVTPKTVSISASVSGGVVPPSEGGTGVASPTAHGIAIAEGSSNFDFLVLTAGQLPIGTTSGDPAGATLTAGAGINITSASGAITIAATNEGLIVNQTTATATLVAGTTYICNYASLITFTLAASPAIGDVYKIVGFSAGGWTIAQNALQSINFGSLTTTVGTGGSLSSTKSADCITIQCNTAATGYTAFAAEGNLTVV